ncbi:YkgJ family cysteine cluster protein [Dysgonomonas sp. 25]|uniref:YkgJ family cysteine cluster protein n=1 Tax=Dysgonomonas sp. 25 TaxID=2302933 RepID=UPI0013D5E1EC|nr:YkgJ family cysteine cluster protein [Dysgonomonas sp. 25]NDV69052.1 YkgJ family cysteine cluster protein [Dysgonomonas sp. 25]
MKEYDNLPLLAEKSRAEFLQYYKKNKKHLEKLDIFVHQLHEEVSEKVDCLACANCCKTLGPAIYDKDIDRIAKALRVKPSEVVAQYLKIDEDGDYVFQSMPCPFLMPDNYCSIYEHRPKACREYPHTDRKKFVQIYKLTVKNTATCPIAYEVLKQLVKK